MAKPKTTGSDMKLTVAHKVIFGFGFIALLLLFTSLSSLWSFAVLSASNSKVNELAVPVQQQSNQAQIQLLKLAKLSALGFTADEQNTISQYQQEFKQADQLYRNQISQLQQLVGAEQELSAQLTIASEQYQVYQQAVSQMFASKLQALQSGVAVTTELTELVQQIDDAGATLVDITYLETPGKKAKLELLSGAASRVDGQLLTLLQTVRETAAFNELNQLNDSQQNIEFALSDMQGNLDYISDLVGEVGATDLWQTFGEQLTVLKNNVAQPDNLVSMKKNQLSALSDARNQLKVSEQSISQAVMALDALLKVADQRFTALQQDASATLSFAQARTIIIMVVLIALAAGAAYLTIKAMLTPLGNINHVLSDVAAGNLSRRLTILQQDEFGQLSDKVNALIEALSTLIRRIVSNTAQLRLNAGNSAAEVQEICNALQSQQQQVSQVNDTLLQLNNSSHQIAGQATQALQEMQTALEQSRQIDKISNDNNALISGLSVQLSDTASMMLKVNTQSNNIGGILATIRGIAEQTNLLALNAAIEAARAGEQGRGFAVVADEVRSLAVRSQQAVDEIKQMIETLQQQSNAAVGAITRGKADAENCVSHTHELALSLQQVNSAISQLHQINNSIASATAAQLALGDQISARMTDMVSLSAQSAAKAENTLEHSAAVEQNAGELEGAVGTFKV